ncbi:MAG: hypothetical protein KJ607_10905 [Bacteroidetes bacterium]|nr:hypothetical protein [Bacteroidota bacterium]
MKAVFVVYNQALTGRIDEVLDKLSIRGFTRWQDVKGRGTKDGEPHLGTHTWPAMNSAILTVIEEEKKNELLKKVDEINLEAEKQGIRAFVWNIEHF